jgi:hypothetical protein
LIAVDDGRAEPALCRLLLRENAVQVPCLRLPEWVLLPERVLGIKRGNGGRIMLVPAALPHICPPLGGLSCIHPPRVGRSAITGLVMATIAV